MTDPATREPACRADVDPNAPATNTAFGIPAYQAGYYSFTPGTGHCVPLNIWAGQAGVSPAAAAWTTTTLRDDIAIDQSVAAATMTGETSRFLLLPGGPVDFVVGAEWRRETSSADRDDWQRGVIPAGAPFPAGTPLGDVSENDSLTFRPQIGVKNQHGRYDASDVFAEVSLPLVADVDPELREVRRPELAGNVHLRWNRRNLGVDWHAQYLGGMLLSFVEIDG